MANKAGFAVQRLIRVKVNNMQLDDFNLSPGEYIKLSYRDINDKIFNSPGR